MTATDKPEHFVIVLDAWDKDSDASTNHISTGLAAHTHRPIVKFLKQQPGIPASRVLAKPKANIVCTRIWVGGPGYTRTNQTINQLIAALKLSFQWAPYSMHNEEDAKEAADSSLELNRYLSCPAFLPSSLGLWISYFPSSSTFLFSF